MAGFDNLTGGYEALPVEQKEDSLFANLTQGFEPVISEPQEAPIIEQPRIAVDETKLPWAVDSYKEVDPNTAAKLHTISNDKNIPFDILVSNKDEYLKFKETDDIAKKIFAKDNVNNYVTPVTAKYLSDPAKLALNRNDVDTLVNMEIAIKDNSSWYAKAGKAFAYEGSKATARTFLDLEKAMLEFVGKRTEDGDLLPANPAVTMLQFANHLLVGKDGGLLDELKNIPALTPEPVKGDSPMEQYAYDFLSGAIPNLLSVGAAVAAGPIAGGVVAGGQILGSNYGELRDRGVDSDRALAASAMSAMLQGVLETYGLSKLGGIFKATGAKQIFNKFLTAIVTETGTELLQKYPESFAMIWGEAKMKGQTPSEQADLFMNKLWGTTKEGLYEAALAAPFALLGASVHLPMDFRKMKQLNADLKLWGYLIDAGKNSELRKTNPVEFENKLQADLEAHGVPTSVFVDTEVLLAKYNQDEPKLRKFLKEMNAEEAYDSAKESKIPLELSKAKWITKFAEAQETVALAKDLQFDPNNYSMNDSKEALKKAVLNLKSLNEEYEKNLADTEYPPQVQDMRKTLMASGLKASDVDTKLAVLLAGAKVFSKITGESNADWFNRVNPLVMMRGKSADGELGSVSFSNTSTIIELFKSANRTTFVHEVSHILTKEFERAVKIDNGQDPILLADYEMLKDSVGGEFNNDAYEKIATAFEYYLMTSKAPSVKLEGVFYKFNQWMTATYKATSAYEKVSPELAGIFDRWIASEKDIEEVSAYYNEKESLVSLMKDIDEKDRVAIEKAKAKSKMRAVTKQANDAIKTFFDIRGGRGEAQLQLATENVNSIPVYAAIEFAKDKGGVDPESLDPYVNEEQYKTIKTRHKGFIAKPFVAKKSQALRSFHDLVVKDYGGININSIPEGERKLYFGKGAGSHSIFIKGARGIDQVAEEMVMDGLLDVGRSSQGGVEALLNHLKNQDKYEDNNYDSMHSGDNRVPEYMGVAELASLMEYDSVEALVDDLLKSENKYKAVTKERMKLDQALEESIKADLTAFENVNGDEAFHNDDRFAYLLKEATELQKQLKKNLGKIKNENVLRPSFTDATVIRNAAKEMVNSKKVKDARDYRVFSFAEKRNGDKSFKALKEGKVEEALERRRAQLLQHAAVQECIRVRDEIKEIENRYVTSKLQGKLNNSEPVFSEAASFLAANYKLNVSKTIKSKAPAKLPDLSKEDDLLYSLIPEWVVNLKKEVDYKNLTVDELRELDEAIQAIIHFGRLQLASFKESVAKTAQDFTAKVIEEAQFLPDFKYDRKGWFNVVEAVMSYGRSMEFIAERLDNFKRIRTKNVKVKDANGKEVILKAEGKYGPSKEVLYNAASDREGTNDSLLGDLYNSVEPSVAVLRKAMRRIAKERQANYRGGFDLAEFPIPDNMKKSGIHKWDGEMMVAFMLNLGNASNMEAITNAYGYSPEQCLAMGKYFQAAELQAIQKLWDTIETLHPKVSQTYYNVYRKKMSKVEAQEVTFVDKNGNDVILKGGYYPLSYDRKTQLFTTQAVGKLIGRESSDTVEDMRRNRLASLTHSVKMTDSFVKDRKSGHFLPPKLSLGVMFEHLSDAARYVSFAEYTRDLQKIINNKDWRRIVTEKLGPDNLARIEEWAEYLALPERRNLDAIDAIAEDQRQKAAMSYLLFKFGTGVKQRAAFFTGMKEIGFKWAMKGLLQTRWETSVLGLSHTEQFEKILLKSIFMRTRNVSMDREMRSLVYSYQNPFFTKSLGSIAGKDVTLSTQSISFGDIEITAKDIQQFAFKWLELNDRAVNVPIWLGAYEKSMFESSKTNLTAEERDALAIRYADDAVRRIQPSNRPSDLSAAQRSAGFMRWMTTVMSWSLKFGNRKGEQWRALKAGQISKADYAAHITYEILAPAIFTTLVGAGLKGEEPEPEDLLWASAGNICQGNFVTDNIAGGIRFGKEQSFAPLEGVDKGLKVGYAIGKMVDGKAEYDLLLKDVAGVFSYQLGVPIPNLVKEAYKLKQGLED